jgi:uncharacterized repeat protein (TIGR02543 family)
VVDINKDGKPELVFGGNVYSINITNRTGTSGNSYKLERKVPDPTFSTTLTRDTLITATIPADFDLDGSVDILAYTNYNFYIYNPVTGAVKVKFEIPEYYRSWGTPFVGDIDGDKYPEIIFGESRDWYPNDAARDEFYISAWDIDAAGLASRTATLKWDKITTDESRSTGLTLFDFDQNGQFEILYRDKTTLRIFNGESSTTMATPLASIPCYSGTLGEYPVIADVDNDGEAEIIVTGAASAGTNNRGSVYIFRAGPGTRWAPARKVWNQYAYNVVNIKEDLTVPKELFDIATIMAGPDSTLYTTDDVQPYNGFLKQATMLDRHGNMVMYAPDAVFDESQTLLSMTGDSVSISFCIVNRGDAVLSPPVYVTLYKDSVKTGNILKTDSITEHILPDSTACLTIGLRDVNDLLPFVQFIVRLNDDGKTYPVQTECDCGDSIQARLNPTIHLMMKKDASIGPVSNRGTYPNPVSVLYSDEIEYTITAVNANINPNGTLIICDTLPAYLDYADNTASDPLKFKHGTSAGVPQRDTLMWTFENIPSLDTVKVTFRATPASGVSASQPMFVNRAWVTASDTIHVPTGNSTYHQGAGVSVVTFSAPAKGGDIYNATPQALDYRTSPRSGILVVPDEGYTFTGWSHDSYTSLRGERIEARIGIMQYDTLTVYGNVELRAVFVTEEYPVCYHLNGGENAEGNPPAYTVESGAITLAAPYKANDVFTGWTGANGDEPEAEVTIPHGSTGERDYYANYLYSGREDVEAPASVSEDKIWSFEGELYVRTVKAGSTVRVYSPDGILYRLQTVVAAGEMRIKLPQGIYIITINNGAGQKVMIE